MKNFVMMALAVALTAAAHQVAAAEPCAADNRARVAANDMERWRVAIGRAHTTRNLPDPTRTELVATALRGIKRTHGTAQRQTRPLLKEDLLAMVAHLGKRLRDRRDRALLLLGFAGAFRRSELVALEFADIQRAGEGLIVSVRRSKADPEGHGRRVAIPHAQGDVCPTNALETWLAAAKITEGPVFRSISRHGRISSRRLSAHAIALIVKERAVLTN